MSEGGGYVSIESFFENNQPQDLDDVELLVRFASLSFSRIDA
jgi:hypothetical protein